MSLPPLPDHPWRLAPVWDEDEKKVLQAYGQQRWETALEDAAKVCDTAYEWFFARHEFEAPKKKYDVASVMRSMKAGVEFVTEDCAKKIRSLK